MAFDFSGNQQQTPPVRILPVDVKPLPQKPKAVSPEQLTVTRSPSLPAPTDVLSQIASIRPQTPVQTQVSNVLPFKSIRQGQIQLAQSNFQPSDLLVQFRQMMRNIVSQLMGGSISPEVLTPIREFLSQIAQHRQAQLNELRRNR